MLYVIIIFKIYNLCSNHLKQRTTEPTISAPDDKNDKIDNTI